MLKSLYIKDYALIESIKIEFGSGLNIITGETGAGKSILIDAMNLLLGERASTDVVRKGASKSIVEAEFDVTKNKKVKYLLEENEIDFTDELIIRREISLKGSNRCFLNDTPVTLNLLKETGNFLVDLHGQHEHQSLLRVETHIDFLDEFHNNSESLQKYKNEFIALNELLSRLKELRNREELIKQKRDLYSFQIKEIDAVSPEEREDERISAELNILENSERILELTTAINNALYNSEGCAFDNLNRAKTDLSTLLKIDPSLKEVVDELETAIALVNDVNSNILRYQSKVELEPEKLDTLRIRLSAINMLKKKYGGSLQSLVEYRNKIGAEFELAENFETEINNLLKLITDKRTSAGNYAAELSTIRIEAAKKITKEVSAALTELGISNSKFEVSIKQTLADNDEEFITYKNKNYKYDSSGFDKVEFFISMNLGEDLKPLVKVASGGEVSRIMLALKSSLARNDKLPILIFDEIDTGISGRIAQKVGNKLKSLSAFHQIIAITHLPQIAGFGNNHYLVEKKTIDNRVVSRIKLLTEEERVTEIAKLISGEKVSETSIRSARELINDSLASVQHN